MRRGSLMVLGFLALAPFLVYGESDVSHSGIVPMGAPYYTPDTSLGLGAIVVFYDQPVPGLTNELTLAGTYTLKNQYSIGADYTYFINRDFLLMKGLLIFADFPQLFFGIGPDTSEEAQEAYRPVSVSLEPKFLVKSRENLYGGPALHYAQSAIYDKEPDGLMESGAIVGNDTAHVAGAGLNVNWDFRDSTFYPTAGGYMDLKNIWYRQAWGSQHDFRRLDFDARYYMTLTGAHILAFQTLIQSVEGEAPFLMLPQLGGDSQMRGYLSGRYRDRHLAFAQAEYRFPIYGIFGGVIFGGTGAVAPQLAALGTRPHFSCGTGLRILMDKQEHINVRLDVGINETGGVDLYFLAKEAF